MEVKVIVIVIVREVKALFIKRTVMIRDPQ